MNVGGPFPDNMVRGGVDADGAVIYIGRAFHQGKFTRLFKLTKISTHLRHLFSIFFSQGDMIPAKVIPDKQTAYVCHGGEEHFKSDVEVLRAGNFVWEFANGGNIPEGGVSCGQTADGELLYVGRCLHQGTQTPGMKIAFF